VTTDRSTLLFFTESFPDEIAMEETFIEPLLPSLADAFRTVIMIPWRRGGATRPMPSGIELDTSLAVALDGLSTRDMARAALTSSIARADIAADRGLLRSPRALKRLATTSARAEATTRWLARFLTSRGLAASEVVAFTFWFDHVTLGLAAAKSRQPGMAVAARVNGSDLYLERHRPAYLPGRGVTLRSLDCVFAASAHADAYLRTRYPGFDRSEVSRLGVPDPGFVSRSSRPGTVVIVSCSSIVGVKRVPLIAGGVRSLAARRPEITIEWHHFGDGPSRAAVEEAVRQLPANATATLHGHTRISDIMAFYRDHPVDLFVNTSISEGGAPVAIVEAASVGLPVVATAVGGNPEVVSTRNGVLIPAHADEDHLAAALAGLLDDGPALTSMRAESRRVWDESFRADELATAFARRLMRMQDVAP
jgi:glycosyltransferase involved in cell wall biosynthesis